MADPTNEHHQASSDRPIQSAKEDRLGRHGFAAELARTIHAWREKDSLVLGLCGPWGTGKSSVVNMVLECLAHPNKGEHATIVVEFNPWEWSGQDQVMEAFFSAVGDRLGAADASAAAKAASKRWQLYAAALNLGSATASGAATLVRGLLGLFGVTALAASQVDIVRDVKAAPVILVASGAALLVVMTLFDSLATWAKQLADFRTAEAEDVDGGLGGRREQVADALRTIDANVLIVIDDIDRLTPPQMLQIFQLVKSNANFPNLVYLLVYERDVVEKGLEASHIHHADRFLEKIVQLHFDVPSASETRVHRVLFEGLERLIGIPSVRRTFDRGRWANVYQGGLQPLFRTLRDVNRYLNTLAVHAAALHVNGFFEVNVVDLIAVEALRVSQPRLHARIREARTLLTASSSIYGSGSTNERQLRQEQAKWLLDGASPDYRANAQTLLMEMFPRLQAVLSNVHHGSDEEWERAARICSNRHFDKYFTLALEDDEIAVGEIERVIMSAHDLTAFRAELARFAEAGRLEALLERLEAYKEQLNPEVCETIATGLFDIGDSLKETDGLFAIDPNMHLSRIIFHFAKHIEPGARSTAVRNAIMRTTGLFAPLMFVSIDGDRKDKTEATETMSDTDLNASRQFLLQRLRAMVADGSLWRHPRLPYILWRWYHWTDRSKEPAHAVQGRLDRDRDSALVVLRAFTSVGKAYTVGQALPTEYPRIDLESLREFVGRDKLLATIETVRNAGALEPADRSMLAAMEKAAREDFKGAEDPLSQVLRDDE